jgi:hypothetical protein
MTAHQLKYTGELPQTFQTGNVGYVEPGAEFTVDESLLLRFMRRPDIEHAGECPAPPCQCGEDPKPEPEKPAASDDASASQDADTSGAGQSGRRGRSGSPSGKKDGGEQ